MLGMLFFGQISRCAAAAFCPTDAEIVAAVRDRTSSQIAEEWRRTEAENPKGIHFIEARRIMGIRYVHCGEPEFGNDQMNCSFTIRYWGSTSFEVAEFRRTQTGWKIETDLAVWRKDSR